MEMFYSIWEHVKWECNYLIEYIFYNLYSKLINNTLRKCYSQSFFQSKQSKNLDQYKFPEMSFFAKKPLLIWFLKILWQRHWKKLLSFIKILARRHVYLICCQVERLQGCQTNERYYFSHNFIIHFLGRTCNQML